MEIKCTIEEVKRRKEIGRVLRANGYSNIRLAEKAGRHKVSVSLWYSGKYNGKYIEKIIMSYYEKCLKNPL